MTIADFNGDGIPDLAVTNYTSQTVSILLGNGDGTFTLKSSPAVGSEPYVGIVTADFNGDGITDLAVPNYNGNSVSILLGNGDGTFAAGTTISTGGTYLYPQYIFTGDFNGDGKPDLAVLAVTNTGVPGLEIFLGNGNATFNLTSTITGPAAMAAPSIGDFNGDGVVDFAVEVGATGNLAPWSLRYYLGNGDGTFSLSPNTVSMSARANKSVAGDFDGDGYSDVVFMTWPASFPDTITTYLQRQSAAATVTGVAVPGPGSHNVLASYGGDGFNSASQSSTVALTGSQIASTAILSVAPGTTFTLGNPASVATGTISPYPVGKYAFTGSEMATLYDGATAIGSAYPNASGQFVFAGSPGPLSDLAVGSHSLTFTFPGDTNYKSSTSAAVPVTVTPGIPTITCSPTPASYVYGSGFVNIQVTLQGFPNQSIPGYNENFSMYIDGGTTPIVTESGWWNTSTSSAVNMEPNIPHWAGISAGTHTLTVKYPGDAKWAAASCSSTITVAADPIGLSYPGHVTSSASPANSGSPVTFSEFGFYDTSWCGAQCTTVPTGTVTFYSDGAPIGAVSPNTSSFASTGYFSAALTISTLPPGTHAITATYSGDANYSSATTSTAFSQVVKTAPTITWAIPASIAYGTVLDGSELNATANTPGTFAYTPAAGTVPSAGTHTLSVTFTPTDTADYSSASATTTLTVTQAAPVITWGSPAGIVYGTALSGAQLNASGSVPGTFVYSPALGTVLEPGTQTLTASFTPNDAVDYRVQVSTVTLTVSPITPSITWAIPAPISYGTPLSATQLDATSGGLAGTIVYTPAVGTVLTAGSQILSATFTPTDTIHYSSRTVTVPLTVTQALPGVTWGSPAAITYGTALDSTELNATASVPGTFVYTPPAGTVLSAGSQVLSVVFSPTDSINYTSQAANVVLTVNPAAPQIVWAMPATIPQGTALGSTQLNATTLNGIAGTFTYVPPAGTVLNTPGSQTVTVTFTPTNSNYKPVSQTKTLNVQLSPGLTWVLHPRSPTERRFMERNWMRSPMCQVLSLLPGFRYTAPCWTADSVSYIYPDRLTLHHGNCMRASDGHSGKPGTDMENPFTDRLWNRTLGPAAQR